MKFSDMPYRRPDAEAVKKLMAELTEQLKNARTFEEADALFVRWEEEGKHIATQGTLAQVRHSIDTRDAFYDAENDFWNALGPELAEYSQAWQLALLHSPFRGEFEKKYGAKMFLDAEIEVRSFSPELIPLMQQENELTTRYGKLIASAQIPFEGGVYTLSQLTPFKRDADDARRLAAWKAEGQWYKEQQPELDAIYDQLVHLRHQMGVALGYANYIPLGYDRMGRDCYGQREVEAFRQAVQRDLVPLASQVVRAQAERLGKAYPLSFADNSLEFRSGNPMPRGTQEQLVEAAQGFYSALSQETGRFFAMMRQNDLMSLASTEGKEGGGYCTAIPDWGVPFIFANFNGTQGDVEVLTHEAGHAFAAWLNRDRIPASYVWPTSEACEVHSMSMEFLAWPWEEGFFGPDADKFRYSHLAAAITFIPYGTMVDHFQHEVYLHPDYTPAQRHGVWKELLGVYMPWLKLDGDIPFYSEGEGWQRQMHIYQSPFYYIDYCLAQTMALQIWARQQKDPADALNTYMAYTRLGGTRVFTDLVREAGLQSPFGADCLREVCQTAADWLTAFDTRKLG